MKKLPVGFEQTILDMASEGCSVVEILKALDLTKKQHCQHLTDNKTYDSAFEKSAVLFEAWWREKGRLGLFEKGFNVALWYKHMVNEFKWRDNPADDKKDPDEVDTKTVLNETAAKYINKKLSVVKSG
jgi:hypothetical protein